MWSLGKVNINVVVLEKKLRVYLVLFGLLLRARAKISLNSMLDVLLVNVRPFY